MGIGSTRSQLILRLQAWYRTYYSTFQTGIIDLQWFETGTVTDQTHVWPLPKGMALADCGGGFYSSKYECVPGNIDVDVNNNGQGRYYGSLFAYHSRADPRRQVDLDSSWTPASAPSVESLLIDGATAISRCAPTNPHASVAQLLGEVRRDGIPAVPLLKSFQSGPRPRSKRHAQAGSEYLNVEFGWKPLLNDIQKITTAAKHADKVLGQYERDSGKVIRRRYEFPTVVESESQDLGWITPAPDIQTLNLYSTPLGHVTRTRVVTRRRWFSGAFTYYVAPSVGIERVRNIAQKANHLYGAGISLGVMWDLTPWSWAADWFANTGDVLNNVSMMQTDGLVLVYGYMMAETTTVVTYNNVGACLRGELPMDLTTTFTSTVKQRVRATPFGFGISMSEFTPRQLAIVAALGLSRDGRKVSL